MAKMKIELKGIEEVLRAMKKCQEAEEPLQQVVKASGSKLQQKAMYYVPVDTGFLKGSIGLALTVGKLEAVVEPTAHYATYVEYGTYKMQSQPYMRPAFYDIEPEFKSEIDKVVKKLTARGI